MKKIADGTVLILIGIAFGSLITFFGCLGWTGKYGKANDPIFAETVAHIFEISLTSLGFLSVITMAVSLAIAALIHIKLDEDDDADDADDADDGK